MKTVKKQKYKIDWVEEIPENLELNTVYISTYRQKVVHKCLCGCGKIITKNKNEFHLNFSDDKNKTFIKELMKCDNTKYFLCKGSKSSNYSPVANFVC